MFKRERESARARERERERESRRWRAGYIHGERERERERERVSVCVRESTEISADVVEVVFASAVGSQEDAGDGSEGRLLVVHAAAL